MPFIGKNPTAGFSTIVKDDLTPDGSTTAFTLSKQVASSNDIAVFVGNVRQEPTDAYSVNGTTLTMTVAPASGINFYVLHIAGTLESSVIPADNTISSAKLQSNLSLSGDLTVDTNVLKVDSTNNRVGIGTTTPTQATLHVAGGSVPARFESTSDATTYVQFGASATTNYGQIAMTGNDMTLRTAYTDRMTIDSAGRILKSSSHPLVQATGAPNIRAVTGTGTENTVIAYTVTYVNNGGHYNTGTGIFTCPVAGWYRVQQHCMVDTAGVSQALYITLNVNGAGYIGSYTSNTGYNINGSSMVYYCNANDQISAMVRHGGKHVGYDSFNVELIG